MHFLTSTWNIAVLSLVFLWICCFLLSLTLPLTSNTYSTGTLKEKKTLNFNDLNCILNLIHWLIWLWFLDLKRKSNVPQVDQQKQKWSLIYTVRKIMEKSNKTHNKKSGFDYLVWTVYGCTLMPSVKRLLPHSELRPWLKDLSAGFNTRADGLEMYKKMSCVCFDLFLSTHYNHSSGSTAFLHCHFSNADLSNRWINAFHVSLTSALSLT